MTHSTYRLHIRKIMIKFTNQLVHKFDFDFDFNFDYSLIECKLLLLQSSEKLFCLFVSCCCYCNVSDITLKNNTVPISIVILISNWISILILIWILFLILILIVTLIFFLQFRFWFWLLFQFWFWLQLKFWLQL